MKGGFLQRYSASRKPACRQEGEQRRKIKYFTRRARGKQFLPGSYSIKILVLN